jgi:hypothetical protein
MHGFPLMAVDGPFALRRYVFCTFIAKTFNVFVMVLSYILLIDPILFTDPTETILGVKWNTFRTRTFDST